MEHPLNEIEEEVHSLSQRVLELWRKVPYTNREKMADVIEILRNVDEDINAAKIHIYYENVNMAENSISNAKYIIKELEEEMGA